MANQFSSVQSLSHVWLFVTPWTEAHQASLSLTNSWSLLKLMSIISSYVVPYSSCLQSFSAPRSFPVRQFFASGGQSTGVSASASVLPMLDFSLYKVISYLLSSFSKRGNWGLRLNAQSWDQKWWSQDNYPCFLISKLIEKRMMNCPSHSIPVMKGNFFSDFALFWA